MSYQFRLIVDTHHDAFYNMGIDVALLESVGQKKTLPTLRLYGWDPPAVSIGYFQGIEEEVNIPTCKARGISVVRRLTGGGAVFHDRELTYSITLPLDHPLASHSIQESYAVLCQGIIRALGKWNVQASFVPINDIVCGGKKISGNAQTRKHNGLLQHGTLLLSVNVDLMFELLKVPQEKARGRFVQEIKERVTALDLLVGRPVSFTEAQGVLVEGFAEALNLEFTEEEPMHTEIERAQELAKTLFSSSEWNFKRR
ncbi:MAG: lipoate--protein ligase family protein [Treponemataceae bacterium]|nr:lipoate--protein ligase family protein [Treponemataceae bacterium]